MKRVLIYVRVSKEEQVHGYSLDGQVAQCRRYFEYRYAPDPGYELTEPFIEAGVSTKYDLRQRPMGSKLFLTANKGDVVLFAKLDRAFRNTVDCLTTVGELQKRGVTVVFLDFQIDTSTAAGEFALTILAAGARMERQRIGERSKEGLHAAMAKGKRPGNAPFGCRRLGPKGQTYYALYGPEWRESLKLYRLIQEGWSIDDIWMWLLREGIERPRTPKELKAGKGREWSKSVIARIPVALERVVELVSTGKVRVVDKTRVPKTVQELREGRDDERDTDDQPDGSGNHGAGPDAFTGGSEADCGRDRQRQRGTAETPTAQVRAEEEAGEAGDGLITTHVV